MVVKPKQGGHAPCITGLSEEGLIGYSSYKEEITMDMTVLENTLDRRRYALEDMIAFLEDRMLEDPHVVQMRDEYLEEYEEIAETQRLIDELESELGRWLTPEELTELSKEHSVVGEVLSRIDWDGSYEA